MTPKQTTKQRAVLSVAHDTYNKELNAHALFKVSNQIIGEDLVQDTFLKTWSYLVKGGKIDLMRAFLFHVLNNLIVDEYRKHKTSSLDILMEKGFEPIAENTDRLLNILDGKTAILLIQQLPEKYRKVMRMKYVQDLTLKEISLKARQSKNTTTVQLHRGLDKLKILHNKPALFHTKPRKHPRPSLR
jgi:RNA polymerase sigma-70 factor (ECF subfamily)